MSASRVILMQQANGRRHSGVQDGGAGGHSQASSAHARVRLKLAALAYVGMRHGTDSRVEVLLASVSALCGAALAYYGALTGRAWSPVEDRTLHWDAMGPADVSDVSEDDVRVMSARIRLKLACVSYESTRHGADAHVEFTRAGIAELTGAAIAYCEALLGTGPGSGDGARGPRDASVVDRTLHLDDGT
jgi:hypothetical protein